MKSEPFGPSYIRTSISNVCMFVICELFPVKHPSKEIRTVSKTKFKRSHYYAVYGVAVETNFILSCCSYEAKEIIKYSNFI